MVRTFAILFALAPISVHAEEALRQPTVTIAVSVAEDVVVTTPTDIILKTNGPAAVKLAQRVGIRHERLAKKLVDALKDLDCERGTVEVDVQPPPKTRPQQEDAPEVTVEVDSGPPFVRGTSNEELHCAMRGD